MHLSFLKALILSCLLSFGGIVCLFVAPLFFIRKISSKKLAEGMVSCRSFFGDFAGISMSISKFFSSLFIFLLFLHKKFRMFCSWLEKRFTPLQKKYQAFLNEMRGRHSIKREKNRGYWKKINGYKDECDLPG
ncbi:hypothetical protein KJ751_02270 [Patescibacteria group bacterium]|nr:hypothetical protein [Patescibacteria group bacterium]